MGTAVPAVTRTFSTSLDLIDRGSPDLPRPLGNPIHAVDVCFSKLSTIRVDWEVSPHFDSTIFDEVLRLTSTAKAEFFQLGQDEGREMVVEHSGLNILCG